MYVDRSVDVPSVGIFIGMTTSTPYGLPSVLSSIQSRALSSSSASLKRTQPRTPRPPARDTAAATCSDGVNAKIGYSMPKASQRAVRIRPSLRSRSVWAVPAFWALSAISLAAGYCALPVALRGISSTRVSARGSL